MNEEFSDDTKTTAPAPFTQDETIVREIGNTTFIITAKYRQDAEEGLADKLLRLIQHGYEDND